MNNRHSFFIFSLDGTVFILTNTLSTKIYNLVGPSKNVKQTNGGQVAPFGDDALCGHKHDHFSEEIRLPAKASSSESVVGIMLRPRRSYRMQGSPHG